MRLNFKKVIKKEEKLNSSETEFKQKIRKILSSHKTREIQFENSVPNKYM